MIKRIAVLVSALTLASGAQAEPAVETLIEAPGPQGALAGSLLLPAGGAKAAALIIPGSGPTDRDGNNPLAGAPASYRLLAEGLAAEGIATVRIDKRGMFGSKAAVPDPNAVTIPDYVADTAAWVRVIRDKTGASCVWLIGHSEGGLVTLAAAQEVDGLCGLVLLATPGRPLGDVLKMQLRANPANAPLIAAADRAIDSLSAGETFDVADLPPPLVPLFNPAVQGFLVSALALDPAALAARTDLPMLIVQGGKDLQVPTIDGERLKAANPAATFALFPDANHVLKDVAGNSPADNLAAYRAANLPLAAGMVSAIARFFRD